MGAVRSLDPAPLARIVEEQFATDADAADTLGLTVAAIRKWRHRTRIGIWTADQVCVRLGYHPIEVFGDDWLNIPDAAKITV
jgi:hypothetical protein